MVLSLATILILGSKGFIGSHLVDFFSGQGHLVTGCDLTEYAHTNYTYHKLSIHSTDFDSIFTGQPFDICINASGSGNVGYSMEHPCTDFESNTYSVAKVLDTIRKFQPGCRYIQLSSAAIYGNPQQLPVVEEASLAPLSAYGWHKYMSELLCKEYYQLYEVKNVILRPFSVYGRGLRKQLLWDLCVKLSGQSRVELFGTGDESRDFIHIDDLMQAVDRIIVNGLFEGEIYNVASGIETPIRDIAKIFEKKFVKGANIFFSGESRAGDPNNWCADISKLKATGFKPVIGLEEGIISYIDWYFSLGGHKQPENN